MTAPAKPGLPLFFPLDIPTTWTPDQALAVFELLTELRDKIWSCYAIDIQQEIQSQQAPTD
ncbi:hypothetical protein [Mesorhizobium huakuii]|uniref:Uncharacterized protein n=1 Tax=Mesorhizobium huakuii TaxID=28104 RepID=A0A7G6T4D9_9HYPH|nr:hypothetical protein [Mesorhizobium huakuii]QND61621.1 hypothetical protein HB778_35655 [Mesorhizobium huakuii]